MFTIQSNEHFIEYVGPHTCIHYIFIYFYKTIHHLLNNFGFRFHYFLISFFPNKFRLIMLKSMWLKAVFHTWKLPNVLAICSNQLNETFNLCVFYVDISFFNFISFFEFEDFLESKLKRNNWKTILFCNDSVSITWLMM